LRDRPFSWRTMGRWEKTLEGLSSPFMNIPCRVAPAQSKGMKVVLAQVVFQQTAVVQDAFDPRCRVNHDLVALAERHPEDRLTLHEEGLRSAGAHQLRVNASDVAVPLRKREVLAAQLPKMSARSG